MCKCKLCVAVSVGVIMCILVWIHIQCHVCATPPIVVGVWSMAGTPWQLFEYFLLLPNRSVQFQNKWTASDGGM